MATLSSEERDVLGLVKKMIEAGYSYTVGETRYTGYPCIVRFADLKRKADTELKMEYRRLTRTLDHLEAKGLLDDDDKRIGITTALYWPTARGLRRAYWPTRPPKRMRANE